MRRVRAGEANIGLVRRCIHGTSDLIGHLTPQANTTDHDFNRRAEEAFWRRAGNPLAFDYAGKLDFLSWQGAIKRSKLRDGDAVTALGEGPSGGGRVMFYEAHQIGDGTSDREKPANLRDGVYLDQYGGRAGFRILRPGGGESWFNLAREDAVYHAGIDRHSRPRAVSGLAHAVSNFLDMVEIIADTKHAIKVAALWGVAMEQSMADSSKDEMNEALRSYLNASGSGIEPGSEETGEILTLDKITQGGRVQGLPAGAKLSTIQDTRPHPNQMMLMSWLVRDMAHGVGLHPELLWDLGALNGTATRYAMADTRRFVENQLLQMERDCQRVWLYILAKEIKAGRLEVPAGMDRWWEARWVPQADLTVDRGREGNLEMAQIEKKMMTRAEMWGRRGMDWEDAERQILIEEKRMAELRKEVGLGAPAGMP